MTCPSQVLYFPVACSSEEINFTVPGVMSQIVSSTLETSLSNALLMTSMTRMLFSAADVLGVFNPKLNHSYTLAGLVIALGGILKDVASSSVVDSIVLKKLHKAFSNCCNLHRKLSETLFPPFV